jgi:hypothetical protein
MSAPTFASVKQTQLHYRNAVPQYFPVPATPYVGKHIVEFMYDIEAIGGELGRHVIGILRPNVKVVKVTYDVITSLTSTGANAAVVGLGILTPGDIIAESALTSNKFIAGNAQAGYPDGSAGKSIALLDKTEVAIWIKLFPLLTGKLVVKIEHR